MSQKMKLVKFLASMNCQRKYNTLHPIRSAIFAAHIHPTRWVVLNNSFCHYKFFFLPQSSCTKLLHCHTFLFVLLILDPQERLRELCWWRVMETQYLTDQWWFPPHCDVDAVAHISYSVSVSTGWVILPRPPFFCRTVSTTRTTFRRKVKIFWIAGEIFSVSSDDVPASCVWLAVLASSSSSSNDETSVGKRKTGYHNTIV